MQLFHDTYCRPPGRRKKILTEFQLFTLSLILWLCSTNSASGQIVLPTDNFSPGWVHTDSQRVFSPLNLYRQINGAAELFLEFGFRELTVQTYQEQRRQQEMQVEVYQMKSPASAMGIFLMRAGHETEHSDIPARNSGNHFQLMITKGNYFISILNVSGDSTLLPVMTNLAKNILRRIEPADTDLLTLLPQRNLIPHSQKIVRGIYSLRSIYTFGPGDILQLHGEIFGVAGDFQYPDHVGYTQIIIRYPDGATCRRAFEHLRANLDSNLRVIKEGDRHLTFKDDNSEYGNVSILGPDMKLVVHLKHIPD